MSELFSIERKIMLFKFVQMMYMMMQMQGLGSGSYCFVRM